MPRRNRCTLPEIPCHITQRGVDVARSDERNSHDNSILNIIEGKGLQVLYQNDKDWHYRSEERRWVSLNDKSCWHKAEMVNGKLSVSIFHIR